MAPIACAEEVLSTYTASADGLLHAYVTGLGGVKSIVFLLSSVIFIALMMTR